MATILRRPLGAIAVIGTVGLAVTGCVQYDSYPTEIPLGEYHAEAPPPSVTGPATSNPLPDNAVPQHPFLAANANSGVHADAYSSGTYSTAGPLGDNPIVQSAIPVDFWRDQQLVALAGECLGHTFNDSGTALYTVCGDVNVFKLLALDVTDDFNRIGVLTMPYRANVGEPLTEQKKDTSGGLYFHLIKDEHGNDQILTSNGDEHIQVIATSGDPSPGTGADYGFTILEDYDVKSFLLDPDPASPDASKITDVMIDWNNANLIWFISKDGTAYVGTVRGLLSVKDGNP